MPIDYLLGSALVLGCYWEVTVKNNIPVETAIKIVGGGAKLAKLVGVKPPTVSQWLKYTRPVPPIRCLAIESATGGIVSRSDLRPDDWHKIWPEFVPARQPGG
jgi:DNA-binding transcriptional regulator YdaS (Cro superfamily)